MVQQLRSRRRGHLPVSSDTASVVGVPASPLSPIDVVSQTATRTRNRMRCSSFEQIARFNNFDYLRLFLAIEVVVGHFWAGMLHPVPLAMPIPPVAAFVGLSGFLIPQSLDRSRTLRQFARKRVLRTIPALIPMLLAITVIWGPAGARGAITQYLTAGYHGVFRGVTLPLWSLIVEDALYLVAALLFLANVHRRWKVPAATLAALLVIDAVVSDEVTRYRLLSTSIAFFAGMLVASFYDVLRRRSWAWPALGATAAVSHRLVFLGSAEAPFLIACVLVVAITLPQVRWKPPDLSYGIYIWHAPIMLALLEGGMTRGAVWLSAAAAATIGMAAASWYLVEKPALRLENR